jgi:hypothetical protein
LESSGNSANQRDRFHSFLNFVSDLWSTNKVLYFCHKTGTALGEKYQNIQKRNVISNQGLCISLWYQKKKKKKKIGLKTTKTVQITSRFPRLLIRMPRKNKPTVQSIRRVQ